MNTDIKPLFIVDDNPVVVWPVIVELPVSGGTYGEFKFDVSMKVLSPEEYERLFEDDASPSVSAEPISAVLLRNVQIFQRLVTGWDGVRDKNGNPVLFTPQKLAEQVTGSRGPALSRGLWRAISEVRYGARLGN